MKVYLVTQGEDCDCSVVAVFKDRPTAERFAGKLPSGDVQEMLLVTSDPREVMRHSAGVDRRWDRETRRWGEWGEIKTWSYELWDFNAGDDARQVVEAENFIRVIGCDSAEQAIALVAERQKGRAS